jgi:hypothetical protein
MGANGVLVVPLAVVWAVGFGRDSSALKVVGILLLALEILVFIVGCVFIHLTNRAMSKEFGFKVWIFNSPTFNDGAFDRWKVRNRITGHP